ncbi:MAG TPA: delta-60 repeat domain-containing protein, partial [Verrucomicrobiae bacterium]|nr:delta-60 repeat domain-containing protein [Verrucomicrobiae bacterium]
SVDPSWQGLTNEKTESLLLLNDGRLLLGGYFTSVNGASIKKIAELRADGTLEEAFTVDVDSFIWTVAPATAGKILISGGFTTIDGLSRRGVARLNVAGGTAPPPTMAAPPLTNPRIESGKFTVTVLTTIGRTYTLESKAAANFPWTQVATAKAGRTFIRFEDALVGREKLYRVSAR